MTFREKLEEYIRFLGISYADLAKASGLSTSALSRYRTGQREPGYDSVQMDAIVKGLAALSRETGTPIPDEDIRAVLSDSVTNGLDIDYSTYLYNLGGLLKALNIKGATLAKALSYDASHISKILSGSRRPGDIGQFNDKVATFIAHRCTGKADLAVIARTIGCGEEKIASEKTMREGIFRWLGSNASSIRRDPLVNFLARVDTFNLDEFIGSLHFENVTLPDMQQERARVRTYTGLKQQMEAELDFIRYTLAGDSQSDCITYSDMPIEEMARDPQFPKRWMLGLSMILNRGLVLHNIHDVNRPFSEMMVGLESNVPLYMTGLIHPYYLPAAQESVFCHLLKVSGSAAMECCCISGHPGTGRYLLSTQPEDIERVYAMGKQLLAKAQPLMEIYRSEREAEFSKRMASLWAEGDRRVVRSSLPLSTISEELLRSILARHKVAKRLTEQIVRYSLQQREASEAFLTAHRAVVEYPEMSAEQFERTPLNLSLADLFLNRDIPYSYEEYAAHLEQLRAFAREHPNLTLRPDPSPTFRNITIIIIEGKCVVVSKDKSPTVHFVIRHPRMVTAFENFVPPVQED